ncbi:hypothetical protein PLIIFM63780_003507 [Purpureocillium lilacinum]|nr:hypothetical protein PLIIFM63780_003507 [Purpureocillium lilacinum]
MEITFQDGPFTGSQAEAIDDGLAAHDSFQDGKSDNAATQKENVDLADNTLSPQEELRLRSMLHSTNEQDQSTGAPDGSEIPSGIVDFEVAKPGQVDEQVPNHTASQYEDDTNPSHINSIIDGHRRKLSYTASPRGIMPFSNGDSNEDSNGRERAASPTRLSSSLKKTVDTGLLSLRSIYDPMSTPFMSLGILGRFIFTNTELGYSQLLTRNQEYFRINTGCGTIEPANC